MAPQTLSQAGKLALATLKNPEESRKSIKNIIIAVLAVFILIILILISIICASFSVTRKNAPPLSSAAESIYIKYNRKVRDRRIKTMGEEYQGTHPGQKIIVTRKNINIGFIIAFLLTKHEKLKVYPSRFTVNENEVYDFLDYATYYETELNDDAYYITSGIHDQEVLRDYFRREPYKKSFDFYYEAIKDNLPDEEEVIIQEFSEFLESIRSRPLTGEVPHYLQYDSRWGNLPIMGGTITTSGCNITSVAMVVSYFLQREILPSDVQAWAWANGGNPYYVAPYGASFALYPAAAGKYGLICTGLGDINAVINELKNGRIVIASCGPGTFTSAGHLIVLRGIDDNGNILVNDPNDNPDKNFHNRSFPPSLFARECLAFWSFWKEGFVPASDEVYLVAQIVALEAGTGNEDWQAAVTECIKNRVESGLFPNTYTEVVSQPYQFTTYAYKDTAVVSNELLALVVDVMNGRRKILNNPKCLYFCSQEFYNSRGKYDNGFWGRMTIVGTYGNIFFAP